MLTCFKIRLFIDTNFDMIGYNFDRVIKILHFTLNQKFRNCFLELFRKVDLHQ